MGRIILADDKDLVSWSNLYWYDAHWEIISQGNRFYFL